MKPVWLIPQRMKWNERNDWFEWPEPKPEPEYEHEGKLESADPYSPFYDPE